jgi:hypothetical protein
MAYKPWTEITNWAKTEGYTTEDIIRYFWWDYINYLKDLSYEDCFREILEGNGKLGIPRSCMPMQINDTFAGQEVSEYLNEPWKDSFRSFVRDHPSR